MPDHEEIAHSLDTARPLLGGRVRVSAARSGVAVGFPRDPFVHLSWFALALAGAVALTLRRGRRL